MSQLEGSAMSRAARPVVATLVWIGFANGAAQGDF